MHNGDKGEVVCPIIIVVWPFRELQDTKLVIVSE